MRYTRTHALLNRKILELFLKKAAYDDFLRVAPKEFHYHVW